MKPLAIAFASVLIGQSAMAMLSDRVACVLDEAPLKKSPVAIVEKLKNKTKILILKNRDQYGDPLLKQTEIEDQSDDALYYFKNDQVELSFYGDETDALGMMEGTINSSVMKGEVKCIYVD